MNLYSVLLEKTFPLQFRLYFLFQGIEEPIQSWYWTKQPSPDEDENEDEVQEEPEENVSAHISRSETCCSSFVS